MEFCETIIAGKTKKRSVPAQPKKINRLMITFRYKYRHRSFVFERAIDKIPTAHYYYRAVVVKKRFELFCIAIGISLFVGCMTSEGALFDTVVDADSAGKKQEAMGEKGKAPEESVAVSESIEEKEFGIEINTVPTAAKVYINEHYQGTSPLFLPVGSGSYKISVRYPGYYPLVHWVSYEAGSVLVMDITLEQITGYLDISASPTNALLELAGEDITQGVSEVPIGSYTLLARAFGYDDLQVAVNIEENETTVISAVLSRAQMRISGVHLSRSILNPANPGRLGTTDVSFYVTTWGSGEVTVYNDTGRAVWSQPVPAFTTWSQRVTWNGNDKNRAKLPDGEYNISITARDEEGTTKVVASKLMVIDSSAVISYRTSWSGTSGLLYVASPETLPPGSFQVYSLLMGHTDPATGQGRFPGQVSLRIVPFEDAEVDVQGSVFIGSDDYPPFAVGAGFTYQFLGLRDNKHLSLGVHGKGTYVGNTTADSQANYTGFAVGTSALLRLGPLGILISPELVLSPTWPNYETAAPPIDFYPWAYGRAGIFLDFGSLVTGISGAVRTMPFTNGFALNLPAEMGWEFHWMIPSTQMVLTACLALEYENADNYYLMGGGGIGLIY